MLVDGVIAGVSAHSECATLLQQTFATGISATALELLQKFVVVGFYNGIPQQVQNSPATATVTSPIIGLNVD